MFVLNAAIAGKLQLKWHDTIFVGYLRVHFRWAVAYLMLVPEALLMSVRSASPIS